MKRTEEQKRIIGWKISQAISEKWKQGAYKNRKRKKK